MLVVLALVALILFGLPWGLVALVAALGLEVLEYLGWKRFLRRYRLRTGPETLVGTMATVVEEIAPLGQVRMQGELWRARSEDPIAEGEEVRITAVDGLTLDVEGPVASES
jgi:membrane-bound serine protease (ClpP class)